MRPSGSASWSPRTPGLKKLLAEAELDKAMLRSWPEGHCLTPERRRRAVVVLTERFGSPNGVPAASPGSSSLIEHWLLAAPMMPAEDIRLYAPEWGPPVRMRGGCGRVGQLIPPAWSSTRSR